MKNSKRFLAIIILAIVAFVSCKKDNENILNAKDNNVQQSFDYRQIEDKITYFKDFRQKMTDSKTDEAFNLEDAAWHLACLANLDFCKVNVEYNSIQFDTVEMQVNVTDGVVLLNDLGTAYEQMHEQILQFKKGFTHNDQNLYFINASINADGNAKIALMSTYTTNSKYYWDHTWYYDDEWDAIDAFYEYFSEDSIYPWNTKAATELQRALNLVEHHGNSYSTCYLPTREQSFDYINTHDPYSSGYYTNSRVFAKCIMSSTLNYNFSFDDMVYCLDSYLGLGYDYISTYTDECPVSWQVNPTYKHINGQYWHYHFHQLKVNYGQLVSINPLEPGQD